MTSTSSELVEVTVRHFDTGETVVLTVKKNTPVYLFKAALLIRMTTLSGPPSKFVLYPDDYPSSGQPWKMDFPSFLLKSCNLVLKKLAADQISIQHSSREGSYGDPAITPLITEASFDFLGDAVETVYVLDTSVVKAQMLQEIPPLEANERIQYVTTKKVFQEVESDPKTANMTWPQSINDCQHLVSLFDDLRRKQIFRAVYESLLSGEQFHTFHFPL